MQSRPSPTAERGRKGVPLPERFPGDGFQTALPLLLKLVESGELSLNRAVESLTWPERCLRRTEGIGRPAADLVISI